MTVAKTILDQLGGHKFVVMTGAKNLVSGNDNLGFRIMKNSSKANYVRITLDDNDTYTIEFIRIYNLTVNVLETFEMVYCDQLQSVFTDYTGLDTHL